MEKHDNDVVKVLYDDGVKKAIIGDMGSATTTSIDKLEWELSHGLFV